jgi:hypothetical protein
MDGRFFAGFLIHHPLIILLFLIPFTREISCGQVCMGGRATALGHTTVVIGDGWALFNNPSCLSDLKHPTAAVLSENRFLLSEMASQGCAVSIPLKSGSWGVGGYRFGFTEYAEWRMGMAYARTFGSFFAAGLRFDFLSTHVSDDHRPDNKITFGIGFRAKLTGKIIVGAAIDDPLPSRLNPGSPKNLNTTVALGLAYHPLKILMLVAQASKNINRQAALTAGVEYECMNHFFLRTGLCSSPLYTTFGTGFIWKRLLFDLAASFHQQLGLTPQVSIQYMMR